MYKTVIATLQSIVKTEVISIWIESRSPDANSKLVPMSVMGYLRCREWGISMKQYTPDMLTSKPG